MRCARRHALPRHPARLRQLQMRELLQDHRILQLQRALLPIGQLEQALTNAIQAVYRSWPYRRTRQLSSHSLPRASRVRTPLQQTSRSHHFHQLHHYLLWPTRRSSTRRLKPPAWKRAQRRLAPISSLPSSVSSSPSPSPPCALCPLTLASFSCSSRTSAHRTWHSPPRRPLLAVATSGHLACALCDLCV